MDGIEILLIVPNAGAPRDETELGQEPTATDGAIEGWHDDLRTLIKEPGVMPASNLTPGNRDELLRVLRERK